MPIRQDGCPPYGICCKTLQLQWEVRQDGASQKGWLLEYACTYLYTSYTRAYVHIYICHISVSISLNMTTTDSLENIPYLCRFLYIIYIYIYHHSSTSFIPLLFHTLTYSDNVYNSKRLDLPPGESWSHRPRDGHGASVAKGMLMIINGIYIYIFVWYTTMIYGVYIYMLIINENYT